MNILSRHKKPGAERCKDAGLALVLLCLVGFQISKLPLLVPAAIMVLLIAMTCPGIFRPFAILWFALSEALGSVVSKLVLSLLFYLLLVPVGLTRRVLGKDPLRLHVWKQGDGSVFRSRNQEFEAKDLEHPY